MDLGPLAGIEHKILGFLWQWKLVTTSALARKFFPNIKLDSAYRRLKNLERSGYIEALGDRLGKAYYWSLANKGFKFIRSYLPALKEDGFRAEQIDHDHLVSAFHLGEWLEKIPDGCQIFSEQQLRRYETGYFPDWVPTDLARRPDGYWKVGKKTQNY